MRIDAKGQVVRHLRVDLPQRIFRLLELHKERTGVSMGKIASGLLIPALEDLFAKTALTETVSAQEDL